MKNFIITVTRKDKSTTYSPVAKYNIADGCLVLEKLLPFQKIIIPLRNVEDVTVDTIEINDTPNGEFAGGDKN